MSLLRFIAKFIIKCTIHCYRYLDTLRRLNSPSQTSALPYSRWLKNLTTFYSFVRIGPRSRIGPETQPEHVF